MPEAMPSAGSRTYCKDSGFKGSNRDSIGSAFRCDMLSIHSLLSGVLSEQSHESEATDASYPLSFTQISRHCRREEENEQTRS